MNVLEYTYDELLSIRDERSEKLVEAKRSMDEINALLKEKNKLEKLRASLGNVSAEDIARVIESITLSAGSIESQENVQL